MAPLDRRKEVEQLDLKVTSKEEKKDEEVTGDPRGWSRVSGVGEVVYPRTQEKGGERLVRGRTPHAGDMLSFRGRHAGVHSCLKLQRDMSWKLLSGDCQWINDPC